MTPMLRDGPGVALANPRLEPVDEHLPEDVVAEIARSVIAAAATKQKKSYTGILGL